MKKFNALFFAMALVAVVAFASLASAATFVGVDSHGDVELIKVDPTADSGSKITYSSVAGAPTLAPAKFTNRITGYKFFSYDGGIVAVSADIVDTAKGGTDSVAFFKVAEDGTVSYASTSTIMDLATGSAYATGKMNFNGVKAVVGLNGNPVFISDKVITAVLSDHWKFDEADTYKSFDISVDTAFAYNDKLYVISSTDASTNSNGYTHHTLSQVSKIEREDDESIFTKIRAEFTGAIMHWADNNHSGAFNVVVAGTNVYIATETGLYSFPLEEKSDTGIILNSAAPEVKNINTNKYLAMTANGDTLYAVKSADVDTNGVVASVVSLVSIKDGTETVLYDKVADDVKINDAANRSSFDIHAGSDNVVAVTNLGVQTAFYALDDSVSKWKLINEKSDVFPSVVLVKASTTPDTPDTPATSTTVVDATKITDETQVANLTKASGAAGTSAFVAQSDVTESTGTAPSTDTQTAVKEKAGFDNSTVATVKDYTLARKGYVLVTTNPGYNAANVKVYFVKKASSSSASVAAAEESFTASLLDSSYAAISTGTSAYATSTSELEAGDYTLVTVTKTASGEGEGEGESGSTTSSSSGGCNAGFAAVSALLVLAFVKKSR